MAVAVAAVVVLVVTSGAGFGWEVLGEHGSPAAADAPKVAAPSDGPTPAEQRSTPAPVVQAGIEVDLVPPPADSGRGSRVVFSQSEQRVWLVDTAGEVARTYLVSGSLYDNLFPGTYEVYSRSRHATSFDLSGTMEYFVRFTHGTGGSAIGFHDIPTSGGEPAQTVAELGTPQSHGCIRQEESDAIALWEFADIGTTVVVTS